MASPILRSERSLSGGRGQEVLAGATDWASWTVHAGVQPRPGASRAALALRVAGWVVFLSGNAFREGGAGWGADELDSTSRLWGVS